MEMLEQFWSKPEVVSDRRWRDELAELLCSLDAVSHDDGTPRHSRIAAIVKSTMPHSNDSSKVLCAVRKTGRCAK
jgi:hypothetical protein